MIFFRGKCWKTSERWPLCVFGLTRIWNLRPRFVRSEKETDKKKTDFFQSIFNLRKKKIWVTYHSSSTLFSILISLSCISCLTIVEQLEQLHTAVQIYKWKIFELFKFSIYFLVKDFWTVWKKKKLLLLLKYLIWVQSFSKIINMGIGSSWIF